MLLLSFSLENSVKHRFVAAFEIAIWRRAVMESKAGGGFSNQEFGHHWEVSQISANYLTDNSARCLPDHCRY